MRLASGIAPVKAYRAAGVKIGIGLDGSASNDGNHMLLEARQAMLLARLKTALRPPEGPDTPLSTSDPSRDHEWMTAREALEIATIGGAAVLGRNDVGALTPGRCADFCAIDLNAVNYAGGLADPVAAAIFCAPQRVNWTVIGGRVIVAQGELTTIDLPAVVAEHNRHAARLAALAG
jgi:cytosine/adenosine deaminase-related metal-dependent hydrolase